MFTKTPGFESDSLLAPKKPYQGRGYQKIGDQIIIHGPRPDATEIKNLVEWENPKAVLWLQSINGDKRIPDVMLLYGVPGVTCINEDGIAYCIDPMKVIFSQGNRSEKRRLATQIRPKERIADMCAGIGYFTITVAKRGANVDAIEINPESYEFLLKNIKINKVANEVNPICGDSRKNLRGLYDRIIIGHFNWKDFLPSALKHTRELSIIHLHTIGESINEILYFITDSGYKARIYESKVKKYGPNVWHMAYDLRLI